MHCTPTTALERARTTFFMAAAIVVACSAQGSAQFGNVINIPPDPSIGDHGSIGSNTQLNLHPGGSIGRSFDVGNRNGTSSQVELNVVGGSIGEALTTHAGSVTKIQTGNVGSEMEVRAGSRVQLSGGRVGANARVLGGELRIEGGELGRDLLVDTDSLLNISGGVVGPGLNGGREDGTSSGVAINISGGYIQSGIHVWSGSATTVTGGILGLYFGSGGDSFNAHAHSHVEVYGGIVDYDFDTFDDADVHFYGNDFRLDGRPLAVGPQLSLNLNANQILEGVLANGTPFALGYPLDDEIAADTLTLHSVPLPPLDATVINVPPSPAPPSIRDGQTLNLRAGGTLGELFRAGRGSVLNVMGGSTGPDAQAIGADITLSSGAIGSSFVAVDSTVHVTGGRLGSYFEAGRGTVVNMSGGATDVYFAREGSQTNIAGGTVTSFVTVASGSEMNVRGGVFAPIISTVAGSDLNLYGGEFAIDGVPVGGLGSPGNVQAINLADGSVLSGILSDGTPVLLARNTGSQLSDSIADGTLTLHATTFPAAAPANIHLPGDAAPQGLRQGQTLTLRDGGQLAETFPAPSFVAGPGSILNIEGGSVGARIEAAGAEVRISGGNLSGLLAAGKSQVEVTGGSAGSFTIASGSVVHIQGGQTFRHDVFGGSQLLVSGGLIQGTNFSQVIIAYPGSQVAISGGIVSGAAGIYIDGNSTLEISGGTLEAPIQAASNSLISLIGSSFVLDGVPLDDLEPGIPREITARDVSLTGTWDNGTNFQFDLNTSFAFGSDLFRPGSVVTVTLVAPGQGLPGDFSGDGMLDVSDVGMLTSALRNGSHDTRFDLNQDGKIDLDDLQHWVTHPDYAHTYFGDSDLNGQFQSSDLVAVFSAGEYEDGSPGNSTWDEGDWNGDGDFTSGDLILAFQDGGYEQGARAALSQAVPEPSSFALALFGILVPLGRRGQYRSAHSRRSFVSHEAGGHRR